MLGPGLSRSAALGRASPHYCCCWPLLSPVLCGQLLASLSPHDVTLASASCRDVPCASGWWLQYRATCASWYRLGPLVASIGLYCWWTFGEGDEN